MRGRLLPLLAAIAVLAALASPSPQPQADEPLVISPEVMADFTQYKARKKPLYFAVSTDGFFSWWSYCIDYNCQSTQNYRQEAIEQCKQEGGTDCVILAAGSEVQIDYRVGDPAAMTPAKSEPCTVDAVEADSPAGTIVAAFRPAACGTFRRYGYYEDAKAFATSDPAKFKVARGWATRHDDIDTAIKQSLEQCAKSVKALGVAGSCELFAIGDIVVRGMSEAELRAAVEIYKKNKDATNADLPPRS